MTLTDALNTAIAGDQIWVLGYEQIDAVNKLYIVPAGSGATGFTLKSGVQLYGGFKGDETSINDRETLGKPYQLKYRSVLSGDIQRNDVVDNTNLIFPANATRSDNATHVLSLNMTPASGENNNAYPTVVNGFSIGGGQADGTDEKGGGIYVFGDNTGGGIFRIERCFLLNSYATLGGAIYVTAEVQNQNNNISLINQCVVYNNAAGERAAVINAGGGICIDGAATVVNSSIFNNENGGLRLSSASKVVNSTVARNSGAGIDMNTTPGSGEFNVFNTIIWGNTLLSAEAELQPNFSHSAFHEVASGDTDGNIYVTKENRGDTDAPMFDAPSLKTSFDRDFNWRQTAYPLWSWNVLEGSVMHGKGDLSFYDQTIFGSEDMAGNMRVHGTTIDIGAYEFQQIPAGRIRYVRDGGTGDGSSWESASGDLQKMIDELAQNNPQHLPGEVWVAAGTYIPKMQVISGATYSASFLMRDGISVFGGFDATNPETNKRDRKVGAMLWEFTNETVLKGSLYDESNTTWNESGHKWTVTGESRHVVFFAPLPSEGKNGFDRITTLNGVTVRGGYAQGNTGFTDFLTDRGAGLYMGINAVLERCIVTENSAAGNGGGVYLYGGRILNSLIYNNNADGNGGAVYIDNAGMVLASMLTNNSANNGGGAYLSHNGVWTDGKSHPEYLILSTSIVSNNTSRRNGAVYCNKGGVLLQNTITNNECPTSTDNTAGNASQTGGLYIDTYGLVINSLLWNNTIQGLNVPMYAKNPKSDRVQFLYTALSGMYNAVWNNVLQREIIELSETNDTPTEGILSPDFVAGGMPAATGVQGSWKGVKPSDLYLWKPITGANIRARGMTLGTFPDEVLVGPEIDIAGERFAQKPAVGAYAVEATQIRYETTVKALKVYLDVDCSVSSHDGRSWATAYRSLNEALAYMASLDAATVKGRHLEFYVLEGNLWPRYAYTNLDPKTATIDIPATKSGAPIYIYGGYHRETPGSNTAVRNPLVYRSVVNGNHEGKDIAEGLYHCIRVASGAEVYLDGFQIINGYAAGEASRQYGAGLLVLDGAEVTVSNCIFENHTAKEGAAIDARNAKLTLNNCVVNNNTNTTEASPVVNCPNLTMNHVTVVNNVGAAPANMGTTSFSAGNTSGNTVSLASVGVAGAQNFVNPSNQVGATMGFDSYLGGYTDFRPLTSSTEAGNSLINKATGTPVELTEDVAGNERNLGGAADMGAYEAILPANGTVVYVTEHGAGKMDGSSWENAIAGNLIYDVTTEQQVGIQTTDSRYIGFYDKDSKPYGETSGASKLFFEHLNESNLTTSNVDYKTETHDGVTHVTGASGINIRNNRQEQFVGGLQYAVEYAAKQAATDGIQRTVWVAGGTYTDYKGFVIRDKVDVLGAFPNEGTPGENDRYPLVSQYIPTNEASEGLDKAKYETIIQIQSVKPWQYNNNGYYEANPSAQLPGQTRKPVLFQPDVCLPTKSPSGRESNYVYYRWHDGWFNNDYWEGPYTGSVGHNETSSNTYRYNLPANQQNGTYVEYRGATWDGFTIRHGFYTDYKANRDGGAGVRMFRGVTVKNCVVTDNFINGHNDAGRGAGIYCDGNNSNVINCFVLNNVNNSTESYGGGMYMILGTSYNTLVANNYAQSNGGGIFIEDAMFYNNTVAYNRSNGSGGLHQWTASSGTVTTLKLYNTIFYGNSNRAIGVSSVNNFNGAWNCYVQTATALDGNVQNKIKNSQIGTGLASPFESSNAQTENNYRLNSTTWCLNHGAEDLGDDYQGNEVVLPITDVDFTSRIKDCAVDIGAYESENEANLGYETVTNTDKSTSYIYYVTQNGAGLRSGASLAHAACAMKLQQILNHAGQTAKTYPTAKVIIKIAGYESAQFVYHANTLSDPNDPKSYTYVIPYGVTVLGGYNDDASDWNDDSDKTKRDPLTYKTVLSAINTSASLEQNVNGYHTVTFGAKPDVWSGADKKTTIDGLYLIDGKATSLAGIGNPNTRGGGAVVPAWAHVRNCVVARCEAVQGGGLYVLPGGTVSGTLVMENKADEGAGIYADNTGVSAANRAHLVSCTVTDNEASEVGGGLFLNDGAMMVTNSVLWGNTAPSDRNISGVLTVTYEDAIWHQMEPGITDFYPINQSFVETYEMPSNFENTAMESNEDLYFASSSRLLKAYSPLIKHGMDVGYQDKLVGLLDVAAVDLQGISRNQTDMVRVDAGAFAFDGGTIPVDGGDDPAPLLTRLFVSQGANVQLPEGTDLNDYIGRSFYTSLTSLDDALEYIKKMRENGLATDKTQFEILIATGTYKPSYRRSDASSETFDQRQNSFVIPQGVSIYGGFSGKELISSKPVGEDVADLTEIPGVTGPFTCMEDMDEILSQRDYSDFNQNGINDPWEMANQVILSGNVNVSEQVKNVYHVLYSDATTTEGTTTVNPVVLDGLSVLDGETSHRLSTTDTQDEIGRGGGLYTNGVPYIINRCRFIRNFAVRGGAIYVRDADLTLIGSILAGNGTVEDVEAGSSEIRGGAVYLAGINKEANLKAINTLWVNNETTGNGGAIGTSQKNEGTVANRTVTVNLMNNTFARNKAGNGASVALVQDGQATVTNTLMWGNEGSKLLTNNQAISYSAAETELTTTVTDDASNIVLSTVNTDVTGPRFAKPSTVAGVAGNDANNQWNMAAISILADAGNGVNPVTTGGAIRGAYMDWMNTHAARYANQYMGYKDNMTTYLRYAGPLDAYGNPVDKRIDIGVYEFQYIIDFPHMEAIYVATTESGRGDGSDWANATSDIRGALVAMANPKGGERKDKKVFIKAGEYALSQLSAGTAFTVSMGNTEYGESLEVKGSYNESGVQDFSKPTIITTLASNADQTEILMAVAANKKPVSMEGLTFINKNATPTGGIGMQASSEAGGKLTLKQVAFRGNKNIGLQINPGAEGQFLFVNTLFADGGTGLDGADSRTTVVNATFVNNQTADLTFADANKPSVYNSVSWKNGVQNLTTEPANNNVAIDGSVANDNVHEGPNFRDPNHTDIYSRDYRIRPSVKLLNKGSNDHYIDYALGLTDVSAVIPTTEVDLGNNARLVDNDIDVGAYEYEAPLQPIIYVKPDLTGTADGKSWETALGDLQGAVDLAGLYALDHPQEHGYVFVHGKYNDNDGLLNLTLKNTKVYGGMNDERSDVELTGDFRDTDAVVSSLLGKRKGMLEATYRSSLNNITISADGGVVDGFVVTGNATVNNGALTTSVVKNDVGGTTNGLLYNSLVTGNGTESGNVSGVQAVNVTATGTIAEVTGNGNNRQKVTDGTGGTKDLRNTYVTDEYWNYQLMETSTDDIDKGTITDLSSYTDLVGHERDLAGNARIRNTVDNGCFETWNICEGMTTDSDGDGHADAYPVTATDYPVGKSVVYVRKNQELKIQNATDRSLLYQDESSAFNPGFLLLEHQAGLRGNGNYISLTNFAVERDIPAGGADLVAMPFDINSTTSVLAGLTPKRYDGSIRAAYDYKFDDGSGTGTGKTAWTETDLDRAGMYEGLLFENEKADVQTLRFYGKSTAPYTENGADKSISLMKYNFNDAWTTEADGTINPGTSNSGTSNRFTHKENMSWNLFGSPYLCAMNYSDLAYGRVLYGYNNGYQTVKTYGDGGTAEGHIPAGSAVFTQTATLKDAETFAVKQPADAKSGDAFARIAPLRIALYAAGATRSTRGTGDLTDDASQFVDELQLEAVDPEMARNDFDPGADGVKWMAPDSLPQIYAERGGGRYALLSAVSRSGEVAVSLNVPAVGAYTFALPEGCDASDYEAVLLKDSRTGRTADLLQAPYEFLADEAGTLAGRFTVSFTLADATADGTAIRVLTEGRGRAQLIGLQADDRIRVYDPNGQLHNETVAGGPTASFQLQPGIFFFNVDRGGQETTVKAVVR